MFCKFRFFGFFLVMVNLLIPANALLLCKTFSWSSEVSQQSNSDGWGHVYTWSVGFIDPIPYCATYRITLTQWSGDNDGEWWHAKSVTYTAQLAAGTRIYANGQVKQVEANQCVPQIPGYPCPWYVNTQLIVGGSQVASLTDSGVNNTNAKDTDIDRGRIQIDVVRI